MNPVRRTLEEVFVRVDQWRGRRVKAVLLIAANFLREHRWPVVILFAWIVLTALAAGGFGRNRVVADDVVFYVQQQAVYICVFSAFLAAGAIHNERKSRRILLVLSKAISRGQYLLAVILGTWAVSFAYALLFGLCGVWLTARATLPSGGVWSIASLVIAGSADRGDSSHIFLDFPEPYVATALALGAFLRAWNVCTPNDIPGSCCCPDCRFCWTLYVSSFAQSGQ